VDSTMQPESHHGVLVSIARKGILIIGAAGIGKSSLALELLYQGHQLIADDSIDVTHIDGQVIGRCPPLLENVLHTRELGLIPITAVFGKTAWQQKHTIDYVVKLQTELPAQIHFSQREKQYPIANMQLPLLILNIHNPASLSHRLLCWLQMQSQQSDTETKFKQRQHHMMKDRTQHILREIL
jgi:HPr kinase/phosphorylase